MGPFSNNHICKQKLSTKKPKQTEDSQLFYCSSTGAGLFSIILHLRIVWKWEKLDSLRVTAIYTRMILALFLVTNVKEGQINSYLSVDTHFPKASILSEWKRSTEERRRVLQQPALGLFIEKNPCPVQTNPTETTWNWEQRKEEVFFETHLEAPSVFSKGNTALPAQYATMRH